MADRSKSKLVTVSLWIKDIKNDTALLHLPDELSDPEQIKERLLEVYHTDTGILESLVERDRIILQWYPEDVDDNAEQLHMRATRLIKEKNYEGAVSLLEKALTLNANDVDYLYKLGLIEYERKKYAEAVQYLEKACRICPIHFRAHLLIGICWIKLRKFDQAETYVLSANRLNRSHIMAYLNLGAIYSIRKRFNEAIEIFNSAIQLSPGESRAYLGLARIYTMLEDFDAANEYFRKVIQLSPGSQMAEYAKRSIRIPEKEEPNLAPVQDRDTQFSKGMGHYLTGDYKTSSNEYKEYLSAHPSDDYGWYLLGETKLRTGELEEAADCFKRAVRLNPTRSLYYKSLGIALYYLGRFKDGITVMKKAIDAGKRDSLCWTLQGVNFLREHRIDEAVTHFNFALKKNPNNPLALYNMALAYVQTDRKTQAVPLLERILSYPYTVPIKSQATTLLKEIQPPV